MVKRDQTWLYLIWNTKNIWFWQKLQIIWGNKCIRFDTLCPGCMFRLSLLRYRVMLNILKQLPYYVYVYISYLCIKLLWTRGHLNVLNSSSKLILYFILLFYFLIFFPIPFLLSFTVEHIIIIKSGRRVLKISRTSNG